MLSERPPQVTVLIATFNRAALLGRTLDSLALSRTARTWNVIVVDNNSTDETRRVVEQRIRAYPVPLHYLFEGQQGKSNALNTALALINADVVAFTDDDVRVPPEWLQVATAPLFERDDIQYTGGPVRPMWERQRPRWLNERGNLGGTIAVVDYGSEPFIFEERRRAPLGVNMCVRRELIDRIGGFRPDLGRRGASLLGQEQAEFFIRARNTGARGLYVPDAALEHFVPSARLTLAYFTRWWFWKGVSHSRLHSIHHRTELGLDLNRVPRLFGIPRYLFRSAAKHALKCCLASLHLDGMMATQHWMGLAYVSGYCWASWRARQERADDGRDTRFPKRTPGFPTPSVIRAAAASPASEHKGRR